MRYKFKNARARVGLLNDGSYLSYLSINSIANYTNVSVYMPHRCFSHMRSLS